MPHYDYPVKSKLPLLGLTIFAIMSQLAAEHKAINLSQGFPDFETNEELIASVNTYMKSGFNQYAPMPGVMKLREAISGKTFDLHSINYSPETEITITSGGTQAIYTVMASCIQEGDEVIIFEPAYDCYVPAVKLHGGIPVLIELEYPSYSINWKEVIKRVTSKTKMIVLNNPGNPSASVLGEDDIKQLQKITAGTGILILSDEVYEHIIFDNHQHLSMARYQDLANRSFIVASFGKLLHTTGWKIGYCLAPANLMAEFRKVHQFMVFSVNTPIQYAIADFLAKRENYLNLSEFYQQKRDYFIQLMKPTKFELLPVAGSYFQLATYKKISEENDYEFCVKLVKEHGVAAIPVSAFYGRPTNYKTIRFCFAKKPDTILAAVERLIKL